MTFAALYHFKYSLRHLLNRLINFRMIGVSEVSGSTVFT